MDNEQVEKLDNKNEIKKSKPTNLFSSPLPIVTILVSMICISIFIGISMEDSLRGWDIYEKWGYFSYKSIIDGKYWALITSCFVHEDFLHILFNVIAITFLGSKIEREIGYKKYLLLLITSGFISSACELFFSSSTGIGISGIAYAFLGFIFICSKKLENFKDYLTKQDFYFSIFSLIASWFATEMDMANIGNYAHLSGLLWGMSFAFLYINEKKYLRILIQSSLLIISLLSIFWNPFSSQWLIARGDQERDKENMDVAEIYFKKAIDIDSEDKIANLNLGYIYDLKGDYNKSAQYYKKVANDVPKIKIVLAEVYLKQNNFDESLKTINEVLAKEPKNLDAVNSLGIIYTSKKDPEAIKIYNRLISSPETKYKSNGYYNLACFYSLTNKTDLSLENLKKSIELDKKFIELARKDKDFNNINKDKRFIILIK